MPMGNWNVPFQGRSGFFLLRGGYWGRRASKQNEKKRHRYEMIGSAGYPNMSPMFSVPGHFRPHVDPDRHGCRGEGTMARRIPQR